VPLSSVNRFPAARSSGDDTREDHSSFEFGRKGEALQLATCAANTAGRGHVVIMVTFLGLQISFSAAGDSKFANFSSNRVGSHLIWGASSSSMSANSHAERNRNTELEDSSVRYRGMRMTKLKGSPQPSRPPDHEYEQQALRA
jgi:hypothetical protein